MSRQRQPPSRTRVMASAAASSHSSVTVSALKRETGLSPLYFSSVYVKSRSARKPAAEALSLSKTVTRLAMLCFFAALSRKRAVRRDSSKTSLPSYRSSHVRQTVISAPRVIRADISSASWAVKSMKPSM